MVNPDETLSISAAQGVAWNVFTPPEILDELVVDLDITVQRGIAWNPNTSVETLIKLATSKDWNVRKGVVYNINTPVNILIERADDIDIDVRVGVAWNINTPVTALIKLVDDVDVAPLDDLLVRNGVLKNPNCPEAVKIWFRMGGFAGMTLAEFVEKVNNGLL